MLNRTKDKWPKDYNLCNLSHSIIEISPDYNLYKGLNLMYWLCSYFCSNVPVYIMQYESERKNCKNQSNDVLICISNLHSSFYACPWSKKHLVPLCLITAMLVYESNTWWSITAPLNWGNTSQYATDNFTFPHSSTLAEDKIQVMNYLSSVMWIISVQIWFI